MLKHQPRLISFDVFGTVLDWRSGLMAACANAFHPLAGADFDRIIDAQGQLQHGPFLDYATITQRSLVQTLKLTEAAATAIAESIPAWPLYGDASLLRDLMQIAPCAAMTNSDRVHGQAIQQRLGFRLDTWLCAEDTRLYKPNPEFWRALGRLRGIEPGPHWWHVSAYADYDLEVANNLGLTTIFVNRPHARPGPATHTATDLQALVTLLTA